MIQEVAVCAVTAFVAQELVPNNEPVVRDTPRNDPVKDPVKDVGVTTLAAQELVNGYVEPVDKVFCLVLISDTTDELFQLMAHELVIGYELPVVTILSFTTFVAQLEVSA